MSTSVKGHELSLVQGASGGWYAGCSECPEWVGGPAKKPIDAAKLHRDAHLATMAGFERFMAFVGGPAIFAAIALFLLATGGAL